MERLSNQTLKANTCSQIAKPLYDREVVKSGIVHLGIGAFHRAHQAVYTEKVLNAFGGDWGIIGASLRSASVADQLEPQDGLYTVVERSGEGERYQVVGAVQRVMVGPQDPAGLVGVMADESIKIVSLTVTEKGYCHDPASGDINWSHPDIQHDLAHLDTPKSAIGYIVAALKVRKQNNIKSFTALSCDNLPDNGNILAKAVTQFAYKIDSALGSWIEVNTAFPCTMIDRIVPATTPDDKAALQSAVGYVDRGVVVTEPFSQWVIEDKFCNDRPEWERVGALVVGDVTAFEHLKLRLLNGSHSLLAYCGYLAGCETVSDAMSKPELNALVKQYMDNDAGTTVYVPEGFDVNAYKDELRNRFKNPALKHRTWQIAMDGSQKLPQRMLGALRMHLESGGHYEVILLALAAWIKYVGAVDEKGEEIDVQDPLAGQLKAVHGNATSSEELIEGMLSVEAVFKADLKQDSTFKKRLLEVYNYIESKGVMAGVARALDV